MNDVIVFDAIVVSMILEIFIIAIYRIQRHIRSYMILRGLIQPPAEPFPFFLFPFLPSLPFPSLPFPSLPDRQVE